MRKKITFILFIFISCFVFAQNKTEIVTIGNKLNSDSNPLRPGKSNSKTFSLYKADEIMISGKITNIAWFPRFLPSNISRNVKIWLNETTSTSLGEVSWAQASTGSVLVYSGTISSLVVDQWCSVNLNTPFNYSAKKNLIVLVELNYISEQEDYGASLSHSSTLTTCQREIMSYSPNKEYGEPNNIRADIQLGIEPDGVIGCEKLSAGKTIVSDKEICPGQEITLNVDELSKSPLFLYAWQKSKDQINWTDISNTPQNNDTLKINTITSPTYVRCKQTCSKSSNQVFSDAVLIDMNKTKYATLPYNNHFDTDWVSICDIKEIPDSNWRNKYLNGNRSWRRNEDRESAQWTDLESGQYPFPIASENTDHSARSHTSALGKVEYAQFSLILNTSNLVGPASLSFDYRNFLGNDYLEVYISKDNGVTTTLVGKLTNTGYNWESQSYTINLLDIKSTQTHLIFRAYGGDDNTDDLGIDNLKINGPTQGDVQNPPVDDFDDPNAIADVFSSSISIYPNPTSGLISISNIKDAKVEIYNVLGEKIKSERALNSTLNFDLSSNPKGLYVIKILKDGQNISKKLIIE